jgi:heme/copper-type cytochrome/quinol oxidase subunit 2
LMPCQEFCGVGHQAMWARVRVNAIPNQPGNDGTHHSSAGAT